MTRQTAAEPATYPCTARPKAGYPPDAVTTLGRSIVRHGPTSNRIYLKHLDPDDLNDETCLLQRLDDLAARHGYTKIFTKVPASVADTFLARGYVEEARIPLLISGHTDGVFLGRFFSTERQTQSDPERVEHVLQCSQEKAGQTVEVPLPEGVHIRQMGQDDAEAMSSLYGQVFATYPVPVSDPAFMRESLNDHSAYFGFFKGDHLIALCGVEADPDHGNAEVTDFAALPDFRDKGLCSLMLTVLEPAVFAMGVNTIYGICRSTQYGANIPFARRGYSFAGTLRNNTGICGAVESMNVWWKRLE